MPSAPGSTPTVSTRDGLSLSLRQWPAVGPPVGTILLVHGLGEHIGRYEHVAAHLTARGWNVVGYDQRGHGRSDGKRGALTTAGDLLDDLCLVTDHVRATEGGAATPCVLFGHSMGGLVAAQFVARALRPVDGLVLTSPALDPGLSFGQRAQLSIGLALVPDMAMSNQLDPSFTSHDPAVVRAYRDDPLVHDRVTARLAKALVDGGREVLAAAPVWRVPTLLMWAGADRIVAPAGSAAFAAAAPVEVVRTRCFDDLYHEILNEQDAGPVFGMLDEWLGEWLDDRVPR